MSDYDVGFFTRMRDILADEYDWFGMYEDNTIECLMDAFESAQNPPKPEEPTGLGAVVEDATGERWLRTATPCGGGPAHWQGQSHRRGDLRRWNEFAAVRVLSEGVQS